jgi:hypothetical protein
MNQHVSERGEWAGSPFPISHNPLVLEPRYPFQGLNGKTLENLGQTTPSPEPKPDYKVRNSWFSAERNCHVYIMQEQDGKITHACLPNFGGHRLELAVNTLGCYQAWSIEAEERALTKLKSILTEPQYRCYVLTGMFLESSARSGLTYLFRKLRPTIALGKNPNRPDQVKIVSILCLHPIGFYGGTFAGTMVPSDDVWSHLSLMRGDEAFFWRKANHHESWEAEAGL